jgi:hypothetical protein
VAQVFQQGIHAGSNTLATNVSQVTAEPRDDSGACREQTQELRDEIVRDVRTAWLGAAQTRYKLGLRSIVELSQAQLQQTEAEIKKRTLRASIVWLWPHCVM